MDNKQKDFLAKILKSLEKLTFRVEELEREVAALKGEGFTPQNSDDEPIDLSLEADISISDYRESSTIGEDIYSEPDPKEEKGFTGLFGGETFIEKAEKPTESRKIDENEVFSDKGKAILDVMAEKLAWYKDIPGPEVKSLRSAIGLGDQVMFIRRLFREDSALYQATIEKLNTTKELGEAVDYLRETFPEWDMESDDVYRFMMAVRRKIR